MRRENGFLVRIDESGEAVEESGRFHAAPALDGGGSRHIDESEVNATAGAIARIASGVLLERLIVSEGVAFHEFGDVSWTAVARRVHVAMAVAPYRALVDLATFSTDIIERVATALPRLRGDRERPPNLRLADHVGAALLPSVCGVIPVQQWAAPHDGKGAWIENIPVAGEPPNWFRPSYRVRPVRAWFHLRAEELGTIDPDTPEAIALLGPIRDRTLRVLCVDRDDVYATTIEVQRIRATAPTSNWYPYGAGCFGAVMML